MRCARTASRAATASRSCCRSRPKSPPPISRSTSSARVALPLAMLFGVDATPIACRIPARRRSSPTRRGSRSSPRSARVCRTSTLVLSVDGAGEGAPNFARDDRACVRAISRRRDDQPDDPALMIYTSGTTGPPKGALHAHRVLLGHLPGVEMPHEFLPQPGDRLLDAGRLGLGRRPARRAVAGLHHGVPVVARAVREIRSRGGLRADGEDWRAQRLHSADGAADAACGANPRGRYRPPPAHARLRRRSARRRDLRMGQASASASPSTNSTARPNAISCCPPAPTIGVSRPGAIGKPVPGHDVAVIRADGSLCGAGRARPDRGARPDPVMFLGLLGQARRRRATSSSATG